MCKVGGGGGEGQIFVTFLGVCVGGGGKEGLDKILVRLEELLRRLSALITSNYN